MEGPKKRGRKVGSKLPIPTLSDNDTVVRPDLQHHVTGVSAATARRLEKAGLFPKRRTLAPRACGYSRFVNDNQTVCHLISNKKAPQDRTPPIGRKLH